MLSEINYPMSLLSVHPYFCVFLLATRKVRDMEELSLELMKVDKAEEARKARRDWLRLLKISPGVWTKRQVSE